MEEISLIVAFSAGVLSFLSPCVLPLVPVYLASLYGPEIYNVRTKRIRLPLLLHSSSFVVGFSAIFIAMGVIAGLTGLAISPAVLNKAAGILLVVFGLFIIAAMKIPCLNYEKRLTTSLASTSGYLRSFSIGAAFSLGWTACIGPILGSILALAAVRATAWEGAYLLATYSLGLGLPFLIIGGVFDSILPLLRQLNRYSQLIHILSGLLLIGMGILILTNNISWLYSLTA